MLRRLLALICPRRRPQPPLDCTGPATCYGHHAGAYPGRRSRNSLWREGTR